MGTNELEHVNGWAQTFELYAELAVTLTLMLVLLMLEEIINPSATLPHFYFNHSQDCYPAACNCRYGEVFYNKEFG